MAEKNLKTNTRLKEKKKENEIINNSN